MWVGLVRERGERERGFLYVGLVRERERERSCA